MDTTLTIALITASAGIAGGLTTGAVSAFTAGRQDKRLEARENARWQRELAEKDRERIYQLFEQIVTHQRELFLKTARLMRQPTPQTRAEQADSVAEGNELALLCSRAVILGADGMGSDALTGTARDIRTMLRTEQPVGDDAVREFRENYNREAEYMKALMADILRRLRTTY